MLCWFLFAFFFAYTEGVPSTYSWLPQLSYRCSLSFLMGEGEDEALKGREFRRHTFSRFSCTSTTRRDIARKGSSLSVLPPLTFWRERTSKLKIWHLDRRLKLIAHTCYFCQHGILDQAVACAYFYRPWAQTQLLNKHFFGEGIIFIMERLGAEQLLLQTQGMDIQTPIPSFKLKRFLTFSQQTPGSILRQSYQNQPCGIPYTRGTHSGFYSICHNCVNPLKQEPEAGQQGDL